MGNYTITINRQSSFNGCAVKYKIMIDDVQVGEIANGQTVQFNVSEGEHKIEIGLRNKTTVIYINAIKNINLTTKARMSDGGISILTDDASVVINRTPTIIASTQNKNTLPVGAIIAIIIVVFVAMFAIIAILSSPSTTDTSGGVDAILQQEDLTPDEKAEQLIQLATTEFTDGDYIEAVNICNKITSTCPETEIAKNMPNYLNEQYGKFKNISASRLMNEYTENIVNADKDYTGQILVIDGVVSGIDKTNNGNNLCVLLKSNTYFASIQLNFDTDQENAVSKLSVGDNIKAIGKCTGKSGKNFIILDGNNVMIEDCYIIK